MFPWVPQNHGIFAVCIIIWLCFKLVFLWLAPPQPPSNFPHAVLKVLAWKATFTHWKQLRSLLEIHKSCLIMVTHTMTVQGSSPYFSIRMYFWLLSTRPLLWCQVLLHVFILAQCPHSAPLGIIHLLQLHENHYCVTETLNMTPSPLKSPAPFHWYQQQKQNGLNT